VVTNWLSTDSSQLFGLAGSGITAASPLNLRIREYIACKGVLSEEKRQKIEGYLYWKNKDYATGLSLPETHPYYLSRPTV